MSIKDQERRFRIGDRIDGRYEVLEYLSGSGRGELYKVRHVHLRDERVVKVLNPTAGASDTDRKRFQREANIAAAINHPNLATLHDFSSLPDGTFYMVEEYVEGDTIANHLARGIRFDTSEVILVANQVLEALSILHSRGIVHRDITPDNLMITRDRGGAIVVKIIDLGIAKPIEGGDRVTSAGAMITKPHYSSPEQLRQAEGTRIDHRTDLYSLGVVLYEMINGRVPFDAASPLAYILKQVNEEVRTVRRDDVESDIPDELDRFIVRLLKVDRNQRFASAEQAREELEQVAATAEASGQVLPVTNPGAIPVPHIPTVETPAPKTGWEPTQMISIADIRASFAAAQAKPPNDIEEYVPTVFTPAVSRPPDGTTGPVEEEPFPSAAEPAGPSEAYKPSGYEESIPGTVVLSQDEEPLGTIVIPQAEEPLGTVVIPQAEEPMGTVVIPQHEEPMGTVVIPQAAEPAGTVIIPQDEASTVFVPLAPPPSAGDEEVEITKDVPIPDEVAAAAQELRDKIEFERSEEPPMATQMMSQATVVDSPMATQMMEVPSSEPAMPMATQMMEVSPAEPPSPMATQVMEAVAPPAESPMARPLNPPPTMQEPAERERPAHRPSVARPRTEPAATAAPPKPEPVAQPAPAAQIPVARPRRSAALILIPIILILLAALAVAGFLIMRKLREEKAAEPSTAVETVASAAETAEPAPVIEEPPIEPPVTDTIPPVPIETTETVAPPVTPAPKPTPKKPTPRPKKKLEPEIIITSTASEPEPPPPPPAPVREGDLVNRDDPGVVDAKLKSLAPVTYPADARRAGAKGKSVVQVLVGPTGKVEDVRILQSSGHTILDNEALKAARSSSFTPGTKDGVPVRIAKILQFNFE